LAAADGQAPRVLVAHVLPYALARRLCAQPIVPAINLLALTRAHGRGRHPQHPHRSLPHPM